MKTVFGLGEFSPFNLCEFLNNFLSPAGMMILLIVFVGWSIFLSHKHKKSDISGFVK